MITAYWLHKSRQQEPFTVSCLFRSSLKDCLQVTPCTFPYRSVVTTAVALMKQPATTAKRTTKTMEAVNILSMEKGAMSACMISSHRLWFLLRITQQSAQALILISASLWLLTNVILFWTLLMWMPSHQVIAMVSIPLFEHGHLQTMQ